jgi:hypothetical protein
MLHVEFYSWPPPSMEATENVECITEIAAITSEMFEAIGVGIGVMGIGINGVVHEMSSRGGGAWGLRHLV